MVVNASHAPRTSSSLFVRFKYYIYRTSIAYSSWIRLVFRSSSHRLVGRKRWAKSPAVHGAEVAYDKATPLSATNNWNSCHLVATCYLMHVLKLSAYWDSFPQFPMQQTSREREQRHLGRKWLATPTTTTWIHPLIRWCKPNLSFHWTLPAYW